MSEIYFDWNATTPLCDEARAAMLAAWGDAWANPMSQHALGRKARRVLEDARACVALLLSTPPRNLVFTSGGTEANNLALANVPGLVTSRLEHPSITRVAEHLERRGVPVRWVPVPPEGRLNPLAVGDALRGLPEGAWVSVAAVNHETGVLQPIGEIAEQAHAGGLRLHVDAVQAVGKVASDHWQAADRLSVAAHKIRGPKGVGALLWRSGSAPEPVLRGGSQERGLRPGTQDAGLVAGFAAAVARAEHALPARDRMRFLRDRIERELCGVAQVNGTIEHRVGHVSNLSFGGWRGDELAAALDLEGVRVASGSACSAGTAEESPVVGAMLGSARALSAVRISLGETSANEEVSVFLSRVWRVLDFRKRGLQVTHEAARETSLRGSRGEL